MLYLNQVVAPILPCPCFFIFVVIFSILTIHLYRITLQLNCTCTLAQENVGTLVPLPSDLFVPYCQCLRKPTMVMQSSFNTVKRALINYYCTVFVILTYDPRLKSIDLHLLHIRKHWPTKSYVLQKEVLLVFSNHPESQRDTQDILISHQLNRHSRAQLENQWNIQWSGTWNTGKLGDKRCRTLLQWYVLLPSSSLKTLI